MTGVITGRVLGRGSNAALPVPSVGHIVQDVTALRALEGSAALPSVVLLQYSSSTPLRNGGVFLWQTAAGTDDGGLRFNAGGETSSGEGWQALPPDVVNPCRFGAVGDGTTDDSAAVARAIAAAPNFGEVRFPKGTFKCRIDISGKPNLTISGAGDSTILTYPANGAGVAWDDGVITIESSSTGCQVRDLQIRGSAITSTPTLQVGIVVQTSSSARIQRVLFAGTDGTHGLNASVVLNGVNDCEISKCRITHAQGHDGTDGVGYGFLVAGDRNKIVDNHITFPSGQGRHAIYVGPGSYNTISRNRCENGWYEQIVVRAEAAQATAYANTIDNNTLVNAMPNHGATPNDLIGAITVGQNAQANVISNNTVILPWMHGIMVTDYDSGVVGETPDANQVISNHIYSPARCGIFSHGANGTLLAGNDVHDAGVASIPNNAIQVLNSTLETAPVRCRIMGNSVDAPGGALYYCAVAVGGGVVGCEVHGNALTAGTVTTLSDAGTSSVLGVNVADGKTTASVLYLDSGASFRQGTGSPEGAVIAEPGSLFLRTDGGAGLTLYAKQTGSGDTGWAPMTESSLSPGITSTATGLVANAADNAFGTGLAGIELSGVIAETGGAYLYYDADGNLHSVNHAAVDTQLTP